MNQGKAVCMKQFKVQTCGKFNLTRSGVTRLVDKSDVGACRQSLLCDLP